MCERSLLRRLGRPLLVLFALLLAAPATSATITWSPVQEVGSAADIALTGTLVEAVNGTGVGASPTVNGVTFVASDVLLSQSYTGDALEGGSSGDVDLDTLLREFDYGNGTSTSISVGGGALVSGENYLIQVFYTDLRGCCNNRTMTFGDGLGNDVDVHANGAGLGQFAIGTFQADGASQTLSMATSGFSNAHITAYQIRQTPEPGTGALLLFGLAALAACRR